MKSNFYSYNTKRKIGCKVGFKFVSFLLLFFSFLLLNSMKFCLLFIFEIVPNPNRVRESISPNECANLIIRPSKMCVQIEMSSLVFFFFKLTINHDQDRFLAHLKQNQKK